MSTVLQPADALAGESSRTLPRVVVLYDEGAFPALELAEAARDTCEVIWVTGWSGARRGGSDRLLRRLGTHVEIDGDLEQAVAEVHRLSPSGIAVFCDAALQPAAEIAEALGLRFHSPRVAGRLRDKFAQRAALAAAGLDVPGTQVLRPGDVLTAAQARARQANWPAVLKPRAGTGSAETFFVDGPDALARTLAHASPDAEFVLEDYLADRVDAPSGQAAAMFSVELLVDGDRIEPIALTGRFPLQPPFRETGSFIPSDVGASDAAEAIRASGEAARALGVSCGILHVEFKRTPDGPRIVEVNGRVGGLVPTLLLRCGGPSILTLAFRLAVGDEIGPLREPDADAPVAFYRAWLPPVGDFRLLTVDGFSELRAHEDIDQAWLNLRPGESVSSREGGGVLGYVAAAFGKASSHDALWPLIGELDTTLSCAFEPAVR